MSSAGDESSRAARYAIGAGPSGVESGQLLRLGKKGKIVLMKLWKDRVWM